MEKLQSVNGNWWFMYGGAWKDLGVKASAMTREQVREKFADAMSEFRTHCEEAKKRRFK